MTPCAAAPTLVTDRLTLRPHTVSDFEPLYALFASERAKYMGGPFPAKTMWYWIAAEVGSWNLQGFGSWGLERRSDGAFIGQIGINKPHHFPEPEIGWVILEAYEGQGFAKEAAKTALKWWWSQPETNTLVSYITPGNTRSEVLARALGAEADPEAALPDGETPDETTVFRHPKRAA